NFDIKEGLDKQEKSDLSFLEEIKRFIEFQINELLKKKDQEILSFITDILQKKSRFDLDSRLSNLNIFDDFMNLFKPFKNRVIFLKNFPVCIESFIENLKSNFSHFYKSEIIKLTIQEKHKFHSTLDCFKRQITIKMNHINDLSMNKEDVLKKSLLVSGIQNVKTYFIKKTNKIQPSDNKYNKFILLKQKLEDLEEIYSTAFSLEVFLTILHFLDKFIRNYRISLQEFNLTLLELKTALKIFNHKDKLPMMKHLSSVLNFYLLENTKKLLIKNQEDLRLFIKQFLTIEESIYSIDLPFDEGLDESLKFFNSILDKKVQTKEIKQLRVKMNI
ncbi:Exocyst complex subunit Sec8m, partial [Pseudoloma neurophilia]